VGDLLDLHLAGQVALINSSENPMELLTYRKLLKYMSICMIIGDTKLHTKLSHKITCLLFLSAVLKGKVRSFFCSYLPAFIPRCSSLFGSVSHLCNSVS